MDEDLEPQAHAFNVAVGAQIRAEAARRRISLVQLAKLTGLGEASVNRYVAGSRPIPMTAFHAMAQAIGVAPQVIVDRAVDSMISDAPWTLAAHHNPGKGKEREARERDV